MLADDERPEARGHQQITEAPTGGVPVVIDLARPVRAQAAIGVVVPGCSRRPGHCAWRWF
jgi:hypothetical protein